MENLRQSYPLTFSLLIEIIFTLEKYKLISLFFLREKIKPSRVFASSVLESKNIYPAIDSFIFFPSFSRKSAKTTYPEE